MKPNSQSTSPAKYTEQRMSKRTNRHFETTEDKECRFHPQINRASLEKVINTGMNFQERQMKYLHDKQQKKRIASIEPTKSRSISNKKNRAIWENLYQDGQRRDRQRESKIKDVVKKMKQQHPRASSQSENIVRNIVHQISAIIFDSFDDDFDGQISSSRINLRAIDPEVLAVVAPILVNMDENERIMTKDLFIQTIQNKLWRDVFELRDLFQVK